MFSEENIKPNRKELKEKSINSLKLGKPEIFDKDLNIIFDQNNGYLIFMKTKQL